TCPTGVATQDHSLMKGLDVDDKAERAASFHEETLHSFMEMIAAAGLKHHDEIKRKHINRRVGMHHIAKYDEIYPEMDKGCLLKKETIPETYKRYFTEETVVT
ncbi:MAG: FMN-binding glutamate synthase family protein, partial [Flavobacteriia bacterium]